jgi:hypothetical protein
MKLENEQWGLSLPVWEDENLVTVRTEKSETEKRQ